MAQQMLFCTPMNSMLTNRLFDSFFSSDHETYNNNNDNELNYKLNLAGTKKDDIKLSSTQDYLVLETPKNKYKLSIPQTCDPKSIEAKYEDGLLTLTINKRKEHKAHPIEIT
jgi:HSP20 family molecular chaperone IbpA